MNRLGIIAVAVLLLHGNMQAHAQNSVQMSIWQNSNLAPLMNPEGVSCDHWSIWVFSDGTSPIPGQQWGAITGGSPGEVQEKWQEALENQRKSDSVLNQHGNHLMGYATHLGPICIAGRQSSQSSLDRRQAEDLFNQIANKLSQASSRLVNGAASPQNSRNILEIYK